MKKISCTSCALLTKEITSIGGIVVSTKHFEVQQDCKIAIPAFMILASKRHIRSIDEFSPEEQHDFIELLSVLRKNMREYLSIQTIYMIQEEDARHFHLWLFPRYAWMAKQFGDKIQSIEPIMRWAEQHFTTKDHKEAVKIAAEKLKNSFDR